MNLFGAKKLAEMKSDTKADALMRPIPVSIPLIFIILIIASTGVGLSFFFTNIINQFIVNSKTAPIFDYVQAQTQEHSYDKILSFPSRELIQDLEIQGKLAQFAKGIKTLDIARVNIFNNEGVLVWSTMVDKGNIGKKIEVDKVISALKGKSVSIIKNEPQKELGLEKFLEIYIPILNLSDNKKVSGVIEFYVDFSEIIDLMNRLRISIFSATLITIFLTAILFFIFFRKQNKQIVSQSNKLANYAKELESKAIQRTAELKSERDQAKSIISSMEEGLLVVDANQKIVLINLMAEKLLEISLNQAIGQNIKKIIVVFKKGAEMAGNGMPIIKALNEKKPEVVSLVDDVYFQTMSGKKFPVALTSVPFKMESGIGAVVVFRDITKEQEIDKAKSEFISLASHQLRTPPTIINWHIEMLLEEKIGTINEKQREYLKEISIANSRMIDLVNSLLNISRIELGTFVFDQQPVDFIKIAKSWISELSPQLNEKNIKLSENFDNNIFLIPADENIAGIIFQNLLTNAIKYTPDGGLVNISISKQNSDIVIKVSDSGYGIPKADQQKIFTKFFRASNAKEIDPSGNGLGLYIVKSILEQIGGRIWFESEGGKGTTFFVSIPLTGIKSKI